MTPNLPTQCTHCGGNALYTCRVNANGHEGPNLLKGLGAMFRFAKFDVVVCETCGHTVFFADEASRQQLKHAPNWTPVRFAPEQP